MIELSARGFGACLSRRTQTGLQRVYIIDTRIGLRSREGLYPLDGGSSCVVLQSGRYGEGTGWASDNAVHSNVVIGYLTVDEGMTMEYGR
jgi:hypothetical protein